MENNDLFMWNGKNVPPYEIVGDGDVTACDFYLLYHGVDAKRTIVESVAFVLDRLNIKYVDGYFSLPSGDNEDEVVRKALYGCRYAVVLFSSNFLDSEDCIKEVNTILLREREENRMITLVTEFCTSPPRQRYH